MASSLQSEISQVYAELVREGLLINVEQLADCLVVEFIPALACVDLSVMNQGAKHG